jgi:hypothetical protein
MESDRELPDGIKPIAGIPNAALRAANALLADMIRDRQWDVPCAALHLMKYASLASRKENENG